MEQKTNKTRFTMRIDEDIRILVQESAQKNRRSMNQEIEYILDRYFKKIEKR